MCFRLVGADIHLVVALENTHNLALVAVFAALAGGAAVLHDAHNDTVAVLRRVQAVRRDEEILHVHVVCHEKAVALLELFHAACEQVHLLRNAVVIRARLDNAAVLLQPIQRLADLLRRDLARIKKRQDVLQTRRPSERFFQMLIYKIFVHVSHLTC